MNHANVRSRGWIERATVTVGVLVGMASASAASEAETPASLKQQAECMYRVLAATSGVNAPKLGFVDSEGWNHPYLEYSASWRGGMFSTRFEAENPAARHTGHWFLIRFVGAIPPGFDVDLMRLVMKRMQTGCRADLEMEID